MLNNDNSNNNNNTTLCCLLSCNIVPHPLATTTTVTRTERQTQFSQYTRDMHLCGLLVVQVWLSLSSLIEFHTQNRVSKCLGSKVIWNSGTSPRLTLSQSLVMCLHELCMAYGVYCACRNYCDHSQSNRGGKQARKEVYHTIRNDTIRNGKEHKFQRQLQLRFCVLPVDGFSAGVSLICVLAKLTSRLLT